MKACYLHICGNFHICHCLAMCNLASELIILRCHIIFYVENSIYACVYGIHVDNYHMYE